MDTVFDKLARSIGNYIAGYANKNKLLEKYQTLTKIEDVINNINETIDKFKDEPGLILKLKEYKIMKEEERDRFLNNIMYDILPLPEILNADDYTKQTGSCGAPDLFILKGKKNKKVDPLTDLNSITEYTKKISLRKKNTNKSSYSSGGCGSDPISYGGC